MNDDFFLQNKFIETGIFAKHLILADVTVNNTFDFIIKQFRFIIYINFSFKNQTGIAAHKSAYRPVRIC
ncbi:MAG: hypothetical protein A2309_02315 [Bacteroidetes bacterium RIFOXYB2_FULL_35_7]|nr:MAG: hypothetical protein A2X01_11205 [Bacteroidetes bacterium GWF2_35_48]OFY94526.1 MAG: hypothetical protein A2309_02315 [Bacteroidetes bacterium RIFOXYB2_FULL_35_7]